MKKLTLAIAFLSIIYLTSALAYTIQIESSSEREVVLSISELETIDIRLTDVKATAETATLSDTYAADYKLEKKGDQIIITVDVSPLYDDYSVDELKSIVISGDIESAGKTEEFAKRTSVRSSAAPRLAPDTEDSMLVYWVTGLALLLAVIIIVLTFKKPKRKRIAKKKQRKKKSKRKKRK